MKLYAILYANPFRPVISVFYTFEGIAFDSWNYVTIQLSKPNKSALGNGKAVWVAMRLPSVDLYISRQEIAY
jgi:hypothetical protein